MSVLIVAVVATVTLAAGCGGKSDSESTSAGEWANNLCSAIGTWTGSVRSAASSLKGNVSESSLKSGSEDISKATGKLEDDLKGLGKPDTESGQKVKETIDTLSGQLKTDVEKIDEAVKGVSGGNGVLTALSTVSSTLSTVGDQVKAAFTNVQQLDTKGELANAFKNASACKSLSSQGS
jgi:hypothetical protein